MYRLKEKVTHSCTVEYNTQHTPAIFSYGIK